MEFFFPHPDDSRVVFQYNDEIPGVIRKTIGYRTEQITLVHRNVNAEEFFFCLIKAKSVHIEDKYQGFAILDGKEFKIRKPYDCKWAIHQLFGVTEDNPLIINDRREKRYIWPFSDKEMVKPHHKGKADSDYSPLLDPELIETFSERKNAFEERSQRLEREFVGSRRQVEEEFLATQTNSWDGFSREKPGPFADFQKELAESTQKFKGRRKQIREEMENMSGEIEAFSTNESFDQLKLRVEEFRNRKRNK